MAATPFCSTTCRDAYRKEHKGREHPSWGHIATTCRICGTAYESAPARVGRGYCSAACGVEAKRRKGRERRSDPELLPGRIKESVKRRDGGGCRICGFRIAVHVHHIQPRSRGGTDVIGNLITLCPNHHAMAHLGLLASDDLLSMIERQPMLVPSAVTGG